MVTGFAKIDHHRNLRIGLPEVIYAAGKTPAQVAEIFKRMAAWGGNVLATRANEETANAVLAATPTAKCHKIARLLSSHQSERAFSGRIAVLSAGTSDLPVAEEAAIAAETMGARVDRIYDVGVAGLHRRHDPASGCGDSSRSQQWSGCCRENCHGARCNRKKLKHPHESPVCAAAGQDIPGFSGVKRQGIRIGLAQDACILARIARRLRAKSANLDSCSV
jgi:hypothetical protein